LQAISGLRGGSPVRGAARIALRLSENWQQFTLLVLIDAFVGGMRPRDRISCHRAISADEYTFAERKNFRDNYC
jgi:hypothetical protein